MLHLTQQILPDQLSYASIDEFQLIQHDIFQNLVE